MHEEGTEKINYVLSTTRLHERTGVSKMTELVYDGFNKIEIIEAEIKGKKVKRERLIKKSAVACILIDDKNRMGLVSQFRPTIGEQTWELPAGVMDKDLAPIEVLLEELEEECEITSKDITEISMTPIHEYHDSIGTSDATIQLYVIKVKNQSDRKVDDADVDELKWFTTQEVSHMINEKEIKDGKTIIGFYSWFTQTLANMALSI